MVQKDEFSDRLEKLIDEAVSEHGDSHDEIISALELKLAALKDEQGGVDKGEA